jgi:branched-chain amino acid transport system permease protein
VASLAGPWTWLPPTWARDVTSVLQNVVDGLAQGSIFALFALGIALIFGIMQLVNFAHGELIMVAAFALTLVSGPPLVVRVLVAVAAAVLIALGMERAAFRPVRGAPPATLLITSFAVSYLLQNVAILIFGSVPRSTDVAGGLNENIVVAGVDIPKLQVVTIGVTLALLAGVGAFLNRTPQGTQMRAAAEDFRAARLLGVRANRVIASAFAMSGVLAAVAAVLLVAQNGTVTTSMGLTPVIFGFTATVLGGLGSLRGAVLGGFVVGAISTTLQATLPLEIRPYRDAFLLTAVIVMLVVRPQGLVIARSTVTRV